MVSFTDAVKMFFQRYADFKGRSTRAEYWWVYLFNMIVFLIFGLIGAWSDGYSSNIAMTAMGLLMLVFMLAIFIPSLALLVRRLHDTDKSGWLALGIILTAIPIVGFLVGIVYIVLCCLPSTEGPNRYGEQPAFAPVEA